MAPRSDQRDHSDHCAVTANHKRLDDQIVTGDARKLKTIVAAMLDMTAAECHRA
jgi:hypothetical protein